MHAAGRRLSGGARAIQSGRWLYGRAVAEGRRRAAATLPLKGPGPGDSLRGDGGYFVLWLRSVAESIDAGRACVEFRPRAYRGAGVDVERFGAFPHLSAAQW